MSKTYNNYNDVQAYEALEERRTATMLDPKYQQWVQELHISQSYVEPEGAIKAKYLNDQYDFSTDSSKSGFLNFLKIKGIWS
jgi:hypothetical protein